MTLDSNWKPIGSIADKIVDDLRKRVAENEEREKRETEQKEAAE